MRNDEEMMNIKRNIRFDGAEFLNFVNLGVLDREFIRGLRNSSEIRRCMFSDKFISRGAHESFINALRGHSQDYYWLVKSKSGGCIGVACLNNLDLKNKSAYLGIYVNIHSPVPHKGSLIMECIKQLSFEMLKLHSLKLKVFCDNKKAVGFYRKHGFIKEGRLRDAVFKADKWRDVLIMGIIAGNQGRKLR